jgi:hypothetical protein
LILNGLSGNGEDCCEQHYRYECRNSSFHDPLCETFCVQYNTTDDVSLEPFSSRKRSYLCRTADRKFVIIKHKCLTVDSALPCMAVEFSGALR